jgi:hypothetical protein
VQARMSIGYTLYLAARFEDQYINESIFTGVQA